MNTRAYISFFLISLLFITQSCKSNIDKTIEGGWVVDTIYYKGYDIKPCVLANMIDFLEEDKRANLCETGKWCDEQYVGKSKTSSGSWEIIQSENEKDTIPLSIKFETDNEIFKGTHKVVFYKQDDKKLLQMEIFSDNLYIICVKTQFNYNGNKKLLDELEKLSWSTRP